LVGYFSARDSIKGALREGYFPENLKDKVFERDAKCPVHGPPSP
jgi:hypothetical protein